MKRVWFPFYALMFVAMAATPAASQGGEKAPPDMVERHDRDGDNRLSIDEFPGPDGHFNHIDADGDGYISEAEAEKAPRPKMGKGRVAGKFYQDDTDGDGVVSRGEFSGPADHFDRLDSNRDGVIDEDEARKGPPDRQRSNMEDR